MRNNTTVALTLWSMLALAGCATTNDVLFVTKTSLGLDFDSKPASASIAYDRTEGYIAPRYDNGEIPPVVASIKSDAKIFNPKISQVYATGDAAVIAVSECPKVTLAALDPMNPPRVAVIPPATSECPTVEVQKKPYTQKELQGNKKLMFFGTTTTTGMKVGFTTYVPDSFVFGFRRKEYSFIPLGTQKETDGTTYDVYPSVLASIDTAANAGELKQTDKPEAAPVEQNPQTKPETDSTQPASQSNPDKQTSLSHSQFFATGRAARELAANPAINKAFIAQATGSLGAELQAEIILRDQTAEVDKVVESLTVQGGNAEIDLDKLEELLKQASKKSEEAGHKKISDSRRNKYKNKNKEALRKALLDDYNEVGQYMYDAL